LSVFGSPVFAFSSGCSEAGAFSSSAMFVYLFKTVFGLFFSSGLYRGTGFFPSNGADRFSRSLPGPGVGAGSLTPYGQAALVTQTSVTAYAHQSPYVLVQLPPEVPLDAVLGLQDPRKAGDLFVRQIVGRLGRVQFRLVDDLTGQGGPDAVDITERKRQPLPAGNVDTQNSWHALFSSTLALFVPGIGTDDPHDTLAAYYLAALTHSFYRGAYFHGDPLCFD
jgi:hypothetical protein